jgi:hypothetical protein
MRNIFLYILLIFLVSCSNHDKINNGNLEVRNDVSSNQDYLDIAKSLLAPSIGEWSYNVALIDSLESWTLYVKDSTYTLVCSVKDIDSNFSGWAIESNAIVNYTKTTCYCGSMGGSNRGKCKAKSDLTCIKDNTLPCDAVECSKKVESTLNWNNYYGADGIAILNMMTLPDLNLVFE